MKSRDGKKKKKNNNKWVEVGVTEQENNNSSWQ